MKSSLAVYALWRRELVRFLRQRSRVTGALAQPIVFWLLLGGGLSASFRPAGSPSGTSYVEYFYPGMIGLVLLFTAIFATISTVDDRKEGFLQGVLVSPVSRATIVLGQALGSTTLAVAQGTLCLLLAPLLGISLSVESVIATMLVMVLVGLALTSLGLIIAWRMDSTQGFHAIMNLILLPIWLLSGALFPITDAPAPLRWLMLSNPMTYGMSALRSCLYWKDAEAAGAIVPLAVALAITAVFCLLSFGGAVVTAQRSAT